MEYLFALFVFCCAAYSAMALYGRWLLNQYLKNKTHTHCAQNGVSVIVAARNERENLEKLLPALLGQDYPRFEVIIADDRSVDGTGPLLQSFCVRHPNLKKISIAETPPGINPKKHAVQKAIEAASYDLLLLTDADCLPVSERWIAEMSAVFSEGKQIVLGFSQYLNEPGLLNFFIRFETLHTAMQYFLFALAGSPYMGVGRNLAYSKALFEKHGFKGYESATGGDDDLFVNKLSGEAATGCAIRLESQTVSIPKKKLKEWYIQKIRHLSVGKKYRPFHKLALAFVFFCQTGAWLGAIILSLNSYNFAWVMVIFLLRSAIFGDILNKAAKALGQKTRVWEPFCFEILYIAYFILLGILSSTKRRIHWK